MGQKIRRGVFFDSLKHAEYGSDVYFSIKPLIRILTLYLPLPPCAHAHNSVIMFLSQNFDNEI